MAGERVRENWGEDKKAILLDYNVAQSNRNRRDVAVTFYI